jgi:putative transposase
MLLQNSMPDSRSRLGKNVDLMEQVSLNSIRQVLPDSAILAACQAVGHVFRRRKITPILTVLHMILAAIWPEESFNASWQVLWDSFAGHCPDSAGRSPSSGSVAKARGRLPLAMFERLFAYLSDRMQARSSSHDCWRGHRVVLVDGTCVSMPDEPELREAFGVNRGCHGEGKYPLARLVTLTLAHTMGIISYAMDRYAASEIDLLRRIVKTLHPGDILIADRHYAGANLYVEYTRAGLHYLTRVHQNLRLSRLKLFGIYSACDFVAWMKINPNYRRLDPTLPREIQVRFIAMTRRVRGRRTVVWLATSLLDARRYPAAEIAELYARRWRIESLLKEVKVRLSADVLRSRTAEGIARELAARLIAVNVVRMILLEAAMAHHVDPLRLSFVHALRAMIVFAPAMAVAPLMTLPTIYRRMLDQIADQRVPDRPDRNEPRAVRREQKHYPTLRITRKEWRLKHA